MGPLFLAVFLTGSGDLAGGPAHAVSGTILENDLLRITITPTEQGFAAGSITSLVDIQSGIDLVGAGGFCSIRCGSFVPMDGAVTVLSDTEAVFTSPGMSDGAGMLPVCVETTFRLVGRGMEIVAAIEATAGTELESPLEMGMDLGAFDRVSLSNQAGLDRSVELTGTHGLMRLSCDQVVGLERDDGLLGGSLLFPNPMLAILALDDSPPPEGPVLSLRFFDTEPPRETAVGPDLHSCIPEGRRDEFFMALSLEPTQPMVFLSAHPSGFERTASWILDDIPFRHPPDTTLWAFSETSSGGEWVSAWLIALLEDHRNMKMNWIVLPDAILAPNCDSMWAEPGYEDSWSHWHSVWRLSEFAPADFRRWLRNIQDGAYPWAGQVTLGSHGYHHTPCPDSAWDPFHEFITFEPAEHMERFRTIREELSACGLDTTAIRALRYPGHRTSLSGLRAAIEYNYDFYCNGIRWYEEIGGEQFLDQYLSHYVVSSGKEIWGSNTVWWGDYPPAPPEYALTVLGRGKHALLGCHPDRMFGWGNPVVYESIDSIFTAFEDLPHFGWLFPEEYGLFLEQTAGIRFSSIRSTDTSLTACFDGSAALGQTMVVDAIPGGSAEAVLLDGDPISWETREGKLFAVLPPTGPGGHSFEVRFEGPVGMESPGIAGDLHLTVINPVVSGSINLVVDGIRGGAGLMISASLFDCAGRLLATSAAPCDASGQASFSFPAVDLPSGFYLLAAGLDGERIGSAATVLLR